MSDPETDTQWDDTADEIDDLVTEGGGARLPYIAFMVAVVLLAAGLVAWQRVAVGDWLSPRPAPHVHVWVLPNNNAVLLRPVGPGQWEPVPVQMCQSCQMLRLP